jgi:uncharacterized membrane protein YhaH (DUF805 family)
MSFVEAIKSFFAKYADFSGRARRSEYWWVVLARAIAGTIVYALTIGPSLVRAITNNDPSQLAFGVGKAIYFLYALALLQPEIALIMRRLHDTGRSGWWYFMGFIPIAGPFIVIYYFVQDGTPGPNAYGADPKA